MYEQLLRLRAHTNTCRRGEKGCLSKRKKDGLENGVSKGFTRRISFRVERGPGATEWGKLPGANIKRSSPNPSIGTRSCGTNKAWVADGASEERQNEGNGGFSPTSPDKTYRFKNNHNRRSTAVNIA